jgi:diketogulonate reductase-like aldo/keto reductase
MTTPHLPDRASLARGADSIPAIGLGTYGLRGRSGQALIEYALDCGYRHLDTAQVYGNERVVGRALRGARVDRDEVYLVTKVWIDHYRRDSVLVAVRESLQKLATDRLDLVLLHWPNPGVALEETLDGLMAALHAGHCRSIGVSNFPVALLERARARCGGALAANQVEYHPFLPQDALLEAVRRAGMALVAHSPLAQGRACRDPVLAHIGQRHGRTAAQVALRWLLQQGGIAAIPKSSQRQRVKENLQVFDFELSAFEMQAIHALAKDRRARLVDPKELAPSWDE